MSTITSAYTRPESLGAIRLTLPGWPCRATAQSFEQLSLLPELEPQPSVLPEPHVSPLVLPSPAQPLEVSLPLQLSELAVELPELLPQLSPEVEVSPEQLSAVVL